LPTLLVVLVDALQDHGAAIAAEGMTVAVHDNQCVGCVWIIGYVVSGVEFSGSAVGDDLPFVNRIRIVTIIHQRIFFIGIEIDAAVRRMNVG
jgi:hypothetical protein